MNLIKSYNHLFFIVVAGMACATYSLSAKIIVSCVGDSITFGAAIKDRGANSYPSQLQKMLGDGYKVNNFGVNGATLLKKSDKPYWKGSIQEGTGIKT